VHRRKTCNALKVLRVLCETSRGPGQLRPSASTFMRLNPIEKGKTVKYCIGCPHMTLGFWTIA